MGAPPVAVREGLAALIRNATLELFEVLAIPAEPHGSFEPTSAVWSDPVSFLGFGGDDLAGSLVVSAPWPLMAQTTPTAECQPEALADWSRELANMLVGGFKMALLARGHHVAIGLPTSIVSSNLRIATSTPQAIGERFLVKEHVLLVALDCVVAPAMRLGAPEPDFGQPTGGDVLFF
jgi:hypothetical protein